MKLLIITTVAEFKKDIYQLFKKANITVYSTTNIDGHKFSDEKAYKIAGLYQVKPL